MPGPGNRLDSLGHVSPGWDASRITDDRFGPRWPDPHPGPGMVFSQHGPHFPDRRSG